MSINVEVQPVIRQQFQFELRNRFRILQTSDQNDMCDQKNSEQPDRGKSIGHMWQKIKTAYNEITLKVLRCRKKNCKNWISIESWRKIEDRKKPKKKIGNARSEKLKNKARNDYREKDK